MNRQEFLLTQLITDCSAVTSNTAQALQFGLHESVQIGNSSRINRHLLESKIQDLLGTLALLSDEDIIRLEMDDETERDIQDKKTEVLSDMEYARKFCKTVITPKATQTRKITVVVRHEKSNVRPDVCSLIPPAV